MAFERKFKVGDKVTITQGSHTGQTGTIKDYVSSNNPYKVYYDNNPVDYDWYRACSLEKIIEKEESQPIELKVGMKVKIREDIATNGIQYVHSKMEIWAGKEVTICHLNATIVCVEENEYLWNKDNLIALPEWITPASIDDLKKGMTVRVNPDLESFNHSESPTINHSMESLAGNVYQVRSKDTTRVYLKGVSWCWLPKWLQIPRQQIPSPKPEEVQHWKVGKSLSDFKKGITVRIRPDIASVKAVDGCSIVADMERMAGKTYTVDNVDSRIRLAVKSDRERWAWMPSYLEILEDNPKGQWRSATKEDNFYAGRKVRTKKLGDIGPRCSHGFYYVSDMDQCYGKEMTVSYLTHESIHLKEDPKHRNWAWEWLEVMDESEVTVKPTSERKEETVTERKCTEQEVKSEPKPCDVKSTVELTIHRAQSVPTPTIGTVLVSRKRYTL